MSLQHKGLNAARNMYSHLHILQSSVYDWHKGRLRPTNIWVGFLGLVPLWTVSRSGIQSCWLHSQQGVQWPWKAYSFFWCTVGVNIGLGFYIHKRKAIVEKFEVELQWVLLLCMHVTLSHVKLTKALRTDACIALLVYFFFSYQASRSMCLWWLMGRWKRDLQRHCHLFSPGSVCRFVCSPVCRKLWNVCERHCRVYQSCKI